MDVLENQNIIGNIEVVWMTYNNKNIFIDEFLKSNKDVKFWIHNHTTEERYAKRWGHDWRNCDRNVRCWWKNNREKCSSTYVLFLEYDVLVTASIYNFFNVPFRGIMTRFTRFTDKNPGWWWFRERNKLVDHLSKFAGCDPFGVACFHRDALDEIIKSEYDILYDSDIFCELRTPSILINSNFDIESNSKLVNVLVEPVEYTLDEGIFHQVR
jgi:hypothetical protein